jgi:hypothetical protein
MENDWLPRSVLYEESEPPDLPQEPPWSCMLKVVVPT